jgi:predicted Holliday junction resolvase-like endonuclease
MIIPSSSLIKIVLVFVMVVIFAGGIYYVTGLRANLAIAAENEKKLTQAIQDQQSVLEQMRQDFKTQQRINQDLVESVTRQRQDIAELTDKFNVNARGERRDFGAVAAAKPAVVERLINRGSINALRCIELASGAALTEKEKNAKTSKDLNPECPGLVQPLVPSFAQ